VALAASASGATAQTRWVVPGPDTTLSVIANGDPVEATLDSLAAAGYVLARVDSTRADTVFAAWGEPAVVRSIQVIGASALDDPTRSWGTREGRRFQLSALAHDLRQSASAYARLGHLRASLVPQVEVAEGGRAVDVTVRIDEGPATPVVGVELAGARGASRAFATRRARVDVPAVAASLDLERVRSELEASELYVEVGDPMLAVDEAGELVVQVPVVEAPPGVFDVVLGYLPPDGGAGGGVVGSGRVDLRNLFGGGRTAHVALSRTPGLASSFEAGVADPFLLGSPFGVGLAFEGASRDSTLSRQRLAAEVRYAFGGGLDVVASLASESVRPGTYGATEVDGQPRVRRRDDVLVGAGVSLVRLDRPRNPRRGLTLALLAEQGRRSGDAFDGARAVRRLGMGSRLYVPTVGRQTVVLGVDATVSQPAASADGLVDEGDLLRLGGAASFRGYDEQALLAQSYVRGVAEYRLLLDDASFAFAFVDAGGLSRPAVPGAEAERRALVGYGGGLRLRTGLGLATVSYALNPDLSPGRGKIHVGLAVGL